MDRRCCLKNACNISRKRSGAVATCGAQPPAVPGVGWFICGLSGFFGVHWGEVGGISTLFLGTQLAVGSIPAHMSRPLNAGYGGTAALCYRHVTLCEHPGGLFAPARPFTHTAAKKGCSGVATRNPANTGFLKISRIRTRVWQVVVRHMWGLPRFFFEICCPNGSSRHSQRSHLGTEGGI